MTRLALLAVLLLPFAAQAQPPPSQPQPRAEARALPPDQTTRQAVDLPGRTLRFTATAGSIHLPDPAADVAFVAYRLEGTDSRTRPVAFAFNGGPGASSAWLQLGALGPWRVRMDGDAAAPSASPELLPNAETWLDFTDLVFIDPVGTGYSRVAAPGDEARRRLWSVNGDIDALAAVIRRWLERNNRLASPKLLVGESYGGFRAPRVAAALQTGQGVGVDAMVIVSPLLDFGGRSGAFDPLAAVARLPSMAAATRGATSREAVADAEGYATGDYLSDLLRGPRDAAALDRASQRVAALTGIDPALVRRRGARVDTGTFLRERDAARGRVGSPYDATASGIDPFPEREFSPHEDPVLDALRAPVTEAMLQLYARLDWRPDGTYELLNEDAARQWDYGRGNTRPESVSALRRALALDGRLRATVLHGLYDLVTPYLATALILNQLPDFGGRARLLVLPGGHMFYARDESRAALREEARRLAAPP